MVKCRVVVLNPLLSVDPRIVEAPASCDTRPGAVGSRTKALGAVPALFVTKVAHVHTFNKRESK